MQAQHNPSYKDDKLIEKSKDLWPLFIVVLIDLSNLLLSRFSHIPNDKSHNSCKYYKHYNISEKMQ